MQLNVRKSANCLSLITTLRGGRGRNLKKNTNSWKNTLDPSPSPSSAYQRAACTAERRPQELKTPIPARVCVHVLILPQYRYNTPLSAPLLLFHSSLCPVWLAITVPIQRKTALCSMFVVYVLISLFNRCECGG